ncbi:GNAT family N-acetyltransferase [Halomarina rubra]|uniref:GNAT family N-acetyltransferase n=1 Tax=Halomarina rubra TaxID=2071873 RepID=A0ABD6B1V8_9EURY|nr:GNAT family N-acetyltransferase [Halomarina rubra]
MPRLTELASTEERDGALSVMQELFPSLDAERFREFFTDDDYRLFALVDDGRPVALTGVSVQRVMHHERHVWVHDLVVTESRRGEGLGRRLLDHVESWGRDHDCESVALATGADRDIARLFYEEQGYEEWGSVYERRL